MKRYALTADELNKLLCARGEPTVDSADRPSGNTPIAPSAVRSALENSGFKYPRRVVGVLNLRGGVGKTTIAVTAASRAAQYGFRTCIIDLDPQASASMAFDAVAEGDEPVFLDLYSKPAAVANYTKEIDEYLHILPSALENSLLDQNLVDPAAQRTAVSGICDQLHADGLDLILIDCPPSLGTAAISAICASDTIVIPVCSEPFSFRGLELSLQEIEAICRAYSLEMPRISVVLSRFDRREKLSTWALEKLRTSYPECFSGTVIPTSTEFSKALARGETIFARRRKNLPRQQYDCFVRQLLELEKEAGHD